MKNWNVLDRNHRVTVSKTTLLVGERLKMPDKEKEIDRFYDMLRKGWMPKPLKIFLILVSMFFAPIFFLIDKILEKREK